MGQQGGTGMMLYFIAIFCSPLALLLTGKPISALFLI